MGCDKGVKQMHQIICSRKKTFAIPLPLFPWRSKTNAWMKTFQTEAIANSARNDHSEAFATPGIGSIKVLTRVNTQIFHLNVVFNVLSASETPPCVFGKGLLCVCVCVLRAHPFNIRLWFCWQMSLCSSSLSPWRLWRHQAAAIFTEVNELLKYILL